MSIRPLENGFNKKQNRKENYFYLKMSSAEWWPFCSSVNTLKDICYRYLKTSALPSKIRSIISFKNTCIHIFHFKASGVLHVVLRIKLMWWRNLISLIFVTLFIPPDSKYLSVRHRSDTKVSDRCLIDVDPGIFAIWPFVGRSRG